MNVCLATFLNTDSDSPNILHLRWKPFQSYVKPCMYTLQFTEGNMQMRKYLLVTPIEWTSNISFVDVYQNYMRKWLILQEHKLFFSFHCYCYSKLIIKSTIFSHPHHNSYPPSFNHKKHFYGMIICLMFIPNRHMNGRKWLFSTK